MKKNIKREYSVLISTYKNDNPEWLKVAVDSMLNQTVKASEIVIVEDGPLTKELNAVINSYEKEHKGLFKIVKLKKNVGLGPALKRGIEECSNEFIARMDSDDYRGFTEDGLILQVTFSKYDDGKTEISEVSPIPIWVELSDDGYLIVPLPIDQSPAEWKVVDKEAAIASYNRTMSRIQVPGLEALDM